MIVDTSKGACRMHHGRMSLALLPVLSSCCACSSMLTMVSYGLVAQGTDKTYVCCWAHCRRKLEAR